MIDMRLPSHTGHAFRETPRADISRSTFNRDHGWKGTVDAGYLYPIFFDETVPGDTFQINVNAAIRLNTLLYPVMDNIFVDFHFFCIPNRLVWTNWEKFMGSQVDPGDSTSYLCPVVTTKAGGHDEGTLADYFGLPIDVDDVDPNAFLFRSYNLVWNEWYRAQYIQDSVTVNTGDGPDAETDYELLRRNKRFDYFTQALPWPSKDNQEVEIAIGSTASIEYNTGLGQGQRVRGAAGDALLTSAAVGSTDANGYLNYGAQAAYLDPTGIWYADLASATAITINELRESFQLQRMLERDARGGNRYCEVIMSHFNVFDPQHAVLQRPEYIGGGTMPVTITAIAQTSESNTTKQGNLAAVGYTQGSNVSVTKSFTEHCSVLGLMSIRADLNYQQGTNRMWHRQTRDDYYFPSYAHLGEQEVLNKEIYQDGSANDDLVFGYVPRYDEMRYKPSVICGALRSTAATPLDSRHLAQEFGSLPTLNSDFIEEDPPVDRVCAVTSEPQFTADLYIGFKATRPMPTFGTPGLIDHL
jgi:hypothetical protein